MTYSSYLKAPLTAGPWRRTLYVLLAVPLTLVSVADGGRLRRRLARPLLHREVPAARLRGLLGLPLDLAALLVVGYGWLLVVLNIGYPLRPVFGLDGSYADAWGGPTLAGAWAVHGLAGGVPALFAMPLILRGITGLQARLLGR